MPYTVEGPLQQQGIAVIDTVQNGALGRRVQGTDPLYGFGEFVLVKYTATVTVGQLVTYDTYNQTATPAAQGARGCVGVVMAAATAGQYGYVQVSGNAVVASGTGTAQSPVYVSATPGTAQAATSATNKIDGAVYKTANGTPAAGFAVVQIAFPELNGNG